MNGPKSSVQIATAYVNINSMWMPRHDTIQKRTQFCISHMKVFLVLDVCIIHGGKSLKPKNVIPTVKYKHGCIMFYGWFVALHKTDGYLKWQ